MSALTLLFISAQEGHIYTCFTLTSLLYGLEAAHRPCNSDVAYPVPAVLTFVVAKPYSQASSRLIYHNLSL